jgi:hypothetical protein
VAYKAVQETKDKGNVTVEGLISTLKQQENTAKRLPILTDIRRTRIILEKSKEICDGSLKKTTFFIWYNKTIAPYVRKVSTALKISEIGSILGFHSFLRE